MTRMVPLLPPVDLLHSYALFGTPAGKPAPGAAAGALGMCMGVSGSNVSAAAKGGVGGVCGGGQRPYGSGKVITLAVRQLIAQQVNLKNIRRAEEVGG